MSHSIVRLVLVAILALSGLTGAFAKPLSGYPYHEIESWQNEGMVFVVRDAEGHIVAHAKGKLERWVSETQMVWVVRDSEGKFMTYARGVIETWKDGKKRLVLRNNEGKFVAVAKVTEYSANSLLSQATEREILHVLAVF